MPTQDQLVQQYGFVGTLGSTIPEIGALLARADAEQWTPETFTRAVQDSTWWKTSSEQRRSWDTLYSTDPATFYQNWNLAKNKIEYMAKEMGYLLPGDSAGTLAFESISSGYDDDQIRRGIAIRFKQDLSATGTARGQAGELAAGLINMASAYGVPMTQVQANYHASFIQNGENVMTDWENGFRDQAKKTYAHLSAQLDSGQTLRDIADPYIAQMAQTLEIPPGGIDLQNAQIKKALDQANPEGKHQTMALWDFERQLKDDPRWGKTMGARNEAWDMAAQIGRDFGFST